MPIPGYTLGTVDQFVGKELGVSHWLTVGQDRIDATALPNRHAIVHWRADPDHPLIRSYKPGENWW